MQESRRISNVLFRFQIPFTVTADICTHVFASFAFSTMIIFPLLHFYPPTNLVLFRAKTELATCIAVPDGRHCEQR